MARERIVDWFTRESPLYAASLRKSPARRPQTREVSEDRMITLLKRLPPERRAAIVRQCGSAIVEKIFPTVDDTHGSVTVDSVTAYSYLRGFRKISGVLSDHHIHGKSFASIAEEQQRTVAEVTADYNFALLRVGIKFNLLPTSALR